MATSWQHLGLVIHLLIQSLFVSSFPRPGLVGPRQSGCDTLVCTPSFDEVVGGAGDLLDDALGIGAGLAGWVIDKATGLLVPQPPKSELQKNPVNGNAQDPDLMYHSGPVDTSQDHCTATSDSNLDDGTGRISVNAQSCGRATPQLVWALNCDNTAQNAAFEVTLKAIDSGVFALESPFCTTEHGLWFWVGSFTPEQIELIKKETHVVKAVERDIRLTSDFRTKSTRGNLNPEQFQKDLTAAPPVEGFTIDKREDVSTGRTIKIQSNANPSLSFLSTPRGKRPSGMYAYFQPTYTGTQVFLIEVDIYEYHPEITGLVKVMDARKLWYNKVASSPDPGGIFTQEDALRGTCLASIIGSYKNGVAKGLEGRLRFVKIYNHVWSFLAGLSAVYTRLRADRYTRIGYIVIVIPLGWSQVSENWEYPDVALSEGEELIARLIDKFQVVFVASAPAGSKEDDARRKNVKSYPAFWAERFPIVVVGGVDVFTGENSPWIYDVPFTVTGPAIGYCVNQEQGGTGIATAYIGGLVAYFLSLPDVGARLRGQSSVPVAMIEYLRRLSYTRLSSLSQPQAFAAWNGLDASIPKKSYSFWIGDPSQDREIPKTPKKPHAPPNP